jgi:hypothetical protein
VEYKQHDLADDEEDEKKIYRAEARAARISKKFSSSSRNPNTIVQSIYEILLAKIKLYTYLL